MYEVKNDKDECLVLGRGLGGCWNSDISTLFRDKLFALKQVSIYGGRVIELGEKPTPEVVSQEEADMLEKAKHNPTLRPSFMITEYSNSHKGNILGNDLEDRLMRAYVIGWTVEKPKQYLVKVKGHFERPTYYALRFNEYLAFGYREQDQQKLSDYPAYPFTDDEIIKYGLENCEKVEVSNKGEKDE